MSRQARDYKAEYARRVTLEQVRADLEVREPSRANARGHRKEPNPTAQLRYWQGRTAFGVDRKVYAGVVKQSVAQQGEQWTLDRLKRKYEDTVQFQGAIAHGESYSTAAVGSQGRQDYTTVYQRSLSFLPPELFWYHPSR